jgi:hypothetical protein
LKKRSDLLANKRICGVEIVMAAENFNASKAFYYYGTPEGQQMIIDCNR